MTHSSGYLFETDQGSVLRCTCCGRFEVRFNNLLVQVDEACLGRLSAAAAHLAARPPSVPCALRLTPDGCTQPVHVLLQRHEWADLAGLLEGACVMTELENILADVLGAR